MQHTHKHHHTLLHKVADNLTQKNSQNAEIKEEAHVVAMSVSQQVLLMTCKLKVTSPDGSNTMQGF